MPPLPSDPGPSSLPLLAKFGALHFALALGCVLLARDSGNVASLWYANTACLALLLDMPPRRWPPVLLVAGGANLLANFLAGGSAQPLLAGVNLLEIGFAAWMVRRSGAGQGFDSNPLTLLAFIACGCLLPPLLGASLVAALNWNGDYNQLATVWCYWYAGSALGALGLLPLALLAARQTVRGLVGRIDWNRCLTFACVAVAVNLFAMVYLPFSFVYIEAALIAAAVALSFEGVALLVWLCSLASGLMIANGAFVLPASTSVWHLLLVYLPLMMTLTPPLLLSASLRQGRERERERAEFQRQAESANEAKLMTLQRLLAQEQANRDVGARMQAILQHAADAILTTDHDWHIESCNQTGAELYGCSEEDIEGRLFSSFLPSGTPDPLPQAQAELALLESGHVDLELPQVRIDGRVFPAELTLSTFQHDGRRKFIAIVRDLTERKKMERMKNDFVSTVSHELRTPLTSIRGGLGLIAGGAVGAVPEAAAKLVRMALNSTERLGRLINDLLDMQKVEAGKMEYFYLEHALPALVEESVAANQAFAQQLGVGLALDGVPPEVALRIDSDRFAQVMTNLISNACKYSPASATVLVRTELRAGWVRIGVQDAGAGIPESFRNRIFQKFSQADSSDTKAKDGTGLGLAITQTIVQQMGGIINYESGPDKGTLFYIEFPVHQEQG